MRLLTALLGTAGGFFFAGPVGAGVGFAAGMLLGSAVSGRNEYRAPPKTGQSSIGGWTPLPAVPPPGDYKWFEQLAGKSKPLVSFRIERGSEAITVTGKAVRIYVENGSRRWVVEQIQTSLPSSAAPLTGSLWTITDANIVSGSNSG